MLLEHQNHGTVVLDRGPLQEQGVVVRLGFTVSAARSESTEIKLSVVQPQ